MTALMSHSLPSIQLQPKLSLFEKHLPEEICTMNGVESVLPHSLIRLPSPKREQAQLSPQDCYGSENSQSNSICDMDPRMVHGLDSKFSAGTLADERANSVSSYKADINHKDDDEDYMNYCSDDSELSVGKEVDESMDIRRNNNDAKSYFRLSDALPINRSHQLKLPSIVRPNPTRQEEFLRKSHLYAEEIMKHQINFMTVTKGLNISPSDNGFGSFSRPNELSPIHNAAINNPPKIGFSRLQAYANDNDLGKKWSVIEDRNAQSPEATHFRQIHSHLNAISKITSALGRDSNTRNQMTSPSYTTSRESSQSPPSTNAASVRHLLHNNFNDSSLKFSIDNILKPSFGRRITDPLKRTKTARKGAGQRSANADARVNPADANTGLDANEKKLPSRPAAQTKPATALPSKNSSTESSDKESTQSWYVHAINIQIHLNFSRNPSLCQCYLT